jgi:radical SAM superfamily enzyme YgiQ (UPF0313 family)
MHYEGNIIRPPSEANSILLQVTVGCSHNKCTFCGVYKDERFAVKNDEVIREDIHYAAEHYRDRNRLFLCDGDPLIMPQIRLLPILKEIRERLPWVIRVTTYANAKSIKRKSHEELVELREHGLRIIHMGLESGDDDTLGRVGKYGDSKAIVEQGLRAKEADIKLFVTVILGLGGVERSEVHAVETGRALTAMNPEYVGALSLMLMPEAPIYDAWKEGELQVPDAMGLLRELRTMIANTELRPGYFYANHASNYLPIRARLPRDKQATLEVIDRALAGEVALKPEWMRGL